MIERHYSPKELGQLLGLNRNTITRAISEGTLEAVSFGKRLLVPESAVLRTLNQGRLNAPGTSRRLSFSGR